MTLAEIRTAVRDEISEPTPGFVSNDEVDRWINRANADLTDAAGIEASASTSITTADGTEAYNLPADFGLIEQVEYISTDDDDSFLILPPLPEGERTGGKGAPIGYYVHAGQLYVVPKPDGVYTLRVWYYRSGSTLSADGDTPIIPTRYHDLIVLFAVSQAKRKGDDPSYQTYLQDYVAGKEGMIAYLRNRGQGTRFSQIEDVDER